MSSRRFHELGLFYGAIPVLAGAFSAYEVSSTQLERRQLAHNLRTSSEPHAHSGVDGLRRISGGRISPCAASRNRARCSAYLAFHHIEAVIRERELLGR